MDIKPQPLLKFTTVDIIDLNFTSEKQFVNNPNNKLTLNITPKVFYPKKSPQNFKIFMEVNIEAKTFFQLSLVAVGNFEANKKIDSKLKNDFIDTNAPAIMFPYVRSFISTLTSNLGSAMIPITIPPQFFNGKMEEKEDLLES